MAITIIPAQPGTDVFSCSNDFAKQLFDSDDEWTPEKLNGLFFTVVAWQHDIESGCTNPVSVIGDEGGFRGCEVLAVRFPDGHIECNYGTKCVRYENIVSFLIGLANYGADLAHVQNVEWWEAEAKRTREKRNAQARARRAAKKVAKLAVERIAA